MSTPTALKNTSAADLIRAVDADIREDWSLFSGYDGFDTLSEFRQVVDHFNQEGLDVEVVYAADGSGVIDMLGFGRYWSNDEIPGRGVYLDHYIDIKHCTSDRSATGLDAAVGYLEVIMSYVHLLGKQVETLNAALAPQAQEAPDKSSTAPVKLCQDCTIRQENEAPDPAYTSNSTCESCHEAGTDCDHEGHAPEDFDSSPCAKCGSTLAGSRHHYAYWLDHERSEKKELVTD